MFLLVVDGTVVLGLVGDYIFIKDKTVVTVKIQYCD